MVYNGSVAISQNIKGINARFAHGDGVHEGSIWEAAMLAGFLELTT